jgi:hypothetical protein
VRIAAFQRDLIDGAGGEHGKRLLVLAPFRAEPCLPLPVGIDAVAVADVHRRGAAESGDGAIQRRDAPGLHVVHVDVVGRLVELDHVDARGLELARFVVQQRRERHGERRPVAVVLVGHGIDDGHGAGQGELELPRRVCAGEAGLGLVHRSRACHRSDHPRAVGLVAVGADADALAVDEIEPGQSLQEPVHEVLARLLALGDDVDAGRLLVLEREPRGVALGLGEAFFGVGPPCRPQRLRLGEPGRLGQAARDGGFQHVCPFAVHVTRIRAETRGHGIIPIKE